MSAMQFILLILIVGIIFMMNSSTSIDKDKLREIGKKIDEELTKEFKKRDEKIEELEKKIKRLEREQK